MVNVDINIEIGIAELKTVNTYNVMELTPSKMYLVSILVVLLNRPLAQLTAYCCSTVGGGGPHWQVIEAPYPIPSPNSISSSFS